MLFSPIGRLRNFGTLMTSGYPVAVDFGVSSLKVLQVAGEGSDSPRLLAMAMVPTPEEIIGDNAKRLNFQAEELARLSRQLGLKGKRAVCGIPAVQTFCKHLQFPRSDSSPVLQQVKTAVAMQIGCHPEALLYRHVEVDTLAQNGKNEVICMAASRELISRLMEVITAAKMEPVGIHPEHLAILHAFDGLGENRDDSTTLYLDLGAGACKMIIAHGDKLVFAKTIHLGGRHLDQVMARQLKIGIEDARFRRLGAKSLTPAGAGSSRAAPEPEGGGMALLSAAMAKEQDGGAARAATAVAAQPRAGTAGDDWVDLREPLETLTDEVAMCLRYHETMFPGRRMTRAVFIGGEARHRGLCMHIAKTLRLPAQVADPLARVHRTGHEPCPGVVPGGAQPGWAMPLGLCRLPTDL